MVLCLLLVISLPQSLAFLHQPATATHTGAKKKPRPSYDKKRQGPARVSSVDEKHCRRRYPIFLASAGDEGIADQDLPMAVSFVGATTSIAVAGTFYAILAWKRDAFMVAFFIGSITNGILSKVLKRIINQSRPPDLATAEMTLKPSDGGMPSSHAMSLGFIGTTTALHVSWAPVPVLLYIVVSLWYRVKVKLHTTAQIMVGAAVGTMHALVFDTCYKDSLMAWLRLHVLDTNGLLPIPLLVVPAIVGVLVVGSVERRISNWLKDKRQQERAKTT